jgi:hypothetical protein
MSKVYAEVDEHRIIDDLPAVELPETSTAPL